MPFDRVAGLKLGRKLARALFRSTPVRALLRAAAVLWLRIQGRGIQRPVWLIACGGDRWGDNADALWRYLRSRHPGIDAVAVIKKGCARPAGDGWIRRGSLQNAALLLVAEVLATTHSTYDLGPRPLVWSAAGRKVWLKHGVTGIRRHVPAPWKWDMFDLVCATSPTEARLLVASRGLEPEVVAVTGFARHDRLFQLREAVERRGILYMPTFRDGDPQEIRELLFSWIGRLRNGGEGARDGEVTVKVWIHPTWKDSGYASLADGTGAIVLPEDDVQEAIVSSRLLVTDYSSVSFDAAIAGVPVVFFQPDREAYHELFSPFRRSVRKGELLLVEDPAEVAESVSRMLADDELMRSRIAMDRKWAARYIDTFDGRSCERLVNRLLDGRAH